MIHTHPALPRRILVLLDLEDIRLADPFLPELLPRAERVLRTVRLPASVVGTVRQVSLAHVLLEDPQVAPALVVLKHGYCVSNDGSYKKWGIKFESFQWF